jgi:ribosomal protein S6
MAEVSQAAEASSQANAPKDSRPVYEVGFHLVPTLDEAGALAAVEQLRTELAKGKAEIISEGAPAKMMLAYTIERSTSGKREKYAEAYFGFIKFATERETIAALEGFLRSTREILRYILIETVREDIVPRRAIYTSDRLEGETIKKPTSAPEVSKGPVSEEELNKSIEALVN